MTNLDDKFKNKNKTELIASLNYACIDGTLEDVEYLLKFSRLSDFEKNSEAIELAFKYAHLNGNVDILQFLICEFKIPRTEGISNHLEEYYDSSIENWFSMRELNENLNQDTSSDIMNNISKKNKI